MQKEIPYYTGNIQWEQYNQPLKLQCAPTNQTEHKKKNVT